MQHMICYVMMCFCHLNRITALCNFLLLLVLLLIHLDLKKTFQFKAPEVTVEPWQ